MGFCFSSNDIERNRGRNEVDTKHARAIPEAVSKKLYNSVFRIEIGDLIGTGFFIKINEIKKFFMFTNCHVISQKLVKLKAYMSIYYGEKKNEKLKVIILDEDKRFIKCFNEPIDITVIEILKEDEIPEYNFLEPDFNYKNEYNNYEQKDLYLAGYPKSEQYQSERQASSGTIKKIFEEFQFEHTLDTREGSSGSPICLGSNLNVIGIHKSGDKDKNINYGTFIGKILDELINYVKKTNKKENNINYNKNKISAEIAFNEKIKKCVCNVSFKNENTTGFFCLVPFENRTNLVRTLITSFRYLENIDNIQILFSDNESRELKIDKNRKIYRPLYFDHGDITIIELKLNDKIDQFLELDESILIGSVAKKDEYLQKIISLFYYSEGKYLTSSLGDIKKIKDNYIFYTCKTPFGSLGAPIISSETNKVIGFHMGMIKDNLKKEMEFENNEEIKVGLLIEDFINEFMNGKNLRQSLK